MGSRLRWVAGVDKEWLKDVMGASTELEKIEANKIRKQMKIQREKEKLKKLKEPVQIAFEEVLSEYLGEPDALEAVGADDQEYSPTISSVSSKTDLVPGERSTRSGIVISDIEEDTSSMFPKVPVRTGPQTLNVNLMSVLVQGIAKFNFSPRSALEFTAMLANGVFGQSWVTATVELEKKLDHVDSSSGSIDQVEPPTKKPKQFQDLSFVLPTRQTLTNWSRDGYILNFKLVAEKVMEAKDKGEVVVLGLDDSLKADGNKKYDVKTGHITIVDKEKTRTTYSTGFSHNISHSGADQAENVNHTFAMMAVLAATTPEEVKTAIDFFIMDRAADGKIMMDELDIAEEKRLNCNGHVILCEAACLDSMFVKLEAKIGAEKLISTKASFVFSGRGSKKQSIWTLGTIAISKLLGPRHCKESISLSSDYKCFLKDDSEDVDSDTQELSKILIKEGFESFSSNRFGRTGSISSSIVKHRPVLQKFFAEAVDEAANKLNLACSAYLESEYFLQTCKIAKHSYENLILPLKEALGIDKFKNQKSKYRSWEGLKQFFNENIAWLEKQKEKTSAMTGLERLQAEAYGKIQEGWERQLSSMMFYREEDANQMSQATLQKMSQANVLTNSGCESHFADLDNMIKTSAGGSSNLETFSQRHVVAKNKYLVSEDWKQMSDQEKRSQFRWARRSPQAKLVNEMALDWLKQIEESGRDLIAKRGEKKKKKIERSLKLLQLCKDHGGPLTSSQEDMQMMETLNEKQLLLEVGYIRCSLDPSIKQRRKVGGKFVKFSIKELQGQIKNCLLPVDTEDNDLESLLLDALIVDSGSSLTAQVDILQQGSVASDSPVPSGTTGWWHGPLGEKQVGVMLTEDTLQMYKKTRYGFVPDDLPVNPSDWKIEAEIASDRVGYFWRRGELFLRF